MNSKTHSAHSNLLKDLPKYLNHHFFRLGLSLPHFFLDFPAFRIAAATACFWGCPDLTISRMFWLITFLDFPDFRGIYFPFFLAGFGKEDVPVERSPPPMYLDMV